MKNKQIILRKNIYLLWLSAFIIGGIGFKLIGYEIYQIPAIILSMFIIGVTLDAILLPKFGEFKKDLRLYVIPCSIEGVLILLGYFIAGTILI